MKHTKQNLTKLINAMIEDNKQFMKLSSFEEVCKTENRVLAIINMLLNDKEFFNDYVKAYNLED